MELPGTHWSGAVTSPPRWWERGREEEGAEAAVRAQAMGEGEVEGDPGRWKEAARKEKAPARDAGGPSTVSRFLSFLFPRSLWRRDSSSIVVHKKTGSSVLPWPNAEVQGNGLKIQLSLSACVCGERGLADPEGQF